MTAERPASAGLDRPAPLVVAKLSALPARAGLVPRPHLLARLDAARDTALTVLSAPAGFGKTTLLTAWLQEARGAAFAWLSLDAEDSEPSRFWAYVLAALRRALPGLPADLDAPLRATPPQVDALVAGLANALAAQPGAVVLILDDYHSIADLAVHRSLAALIERCPPALRLVIAGRADPPLPLARLQARGQLTTLRAADLRFSGAEAEAFLRRTMGLDLGGATIAALDSSTEGWPAGLQLAALWLRDHPLAADGLTALVDADRYLIAFLAEEVIQRQPPEIQRFLLDTAILDRWCPELCDYVTADARRPEGGGPPPIARPSAQIIAELDRRNLFVVALDPSGGWYRYHTLFGDALRRELARRRGGGAVVRLHRRAAAWFAAASAEEPALLEAALRHAAAGQAYELAADLIVPRFDELSAQGQIGRLSAWLAALPPAALAARPALAVRYAWALFLHGRQDEAARWLEAAEAGLAERPVAEPLTAALPHILRAAMATNRHDDEAVLRHVERAEALLPPDAAFWTAMIAIARGLRHLVRGEARQAATALQHAADLSDHAGSSYALLTSTWHLGRARLALGRPADAARAFAQIGADGDPLYAGYRDVGLALVAYDRDRPAEARERALRGLRALEAVAGQPRVIIAAHALLARLARDAGEPAEAAARLDRGEALARHLGLDEELAEVLALRATFASQDGDLAAAEEWAAAAGLDPATPDVRREAEQLALAHLLAARGDGAAALGLAGALRAIAEEQGRLRSAARCELACAFAHARAGAAARRGPVARAIGDGYYEALSERELRVLGLIAAGCSNQEIASALIVSVNTVKTHIKRIYEKLQVNSRVGAVERARELGLHR